jgi:hypothetical protein
MKRSGAEFVVALLFLIAPFACAQDGQLRTMDEIRTWHVRVGASTAEVKLSSFAHSGRPEDTIVSFVLADGSPVLTVGQIADLLQQTFEEMPGLGYCPDKLRRIAFPLSSTELESGVNRAVVSSGHWKKKCVGRQTCYSIEHVVSDYLRSSEALRPVEPVLKKHHLERTNVFTDDPACGFVPRSTPGALHVGRHSLSCGGQILIDLQPEQLLGVYTRNPEITHR